MADEIDKAEELNETYLRAALSQRRAGGPQANGLCLNCDEPVAIGLRWCDKDCLTDWEKRQEFAPKNIEIGE